MRALAWLAFYCGWVYVTWRIYQHSHGGALAFAVAGIPVTLIAGNTYRAWGGRRTG